MSIIMKQKALLHRLLKFVVCIAKLITGKNLYTFGKTQKVS